MARFMRKGTSKFYFVPTVAVKTAPTVAEITAGTVLTTQLGEIAGFEFVNAPVNTPDMSSTFVAQVPGEDTAGASSYTFYEDKTTNPIRTALAKGANGYIVKFPVGLAGSTPAASDKCEVWPVQVSGNNRLWSSGNDAAMYRVSFAITGEPEQNAVVAA